MILGPLIIGFCKITSLALSSFILLFLLLHDWVDLYPLNDLSSFNKHCSLRNKILMTMFNGLFFVVYVGILLWYWSLPFSFHAKMYLIICNAFFLVGIIFSWWVPYFFGWPKKQVEELSQIYISTHRFLPPRGSNPVVPNTLHVIFHIVFVINMIATYLILI